ncbi:hypothetical protein L195_g029517 [Trifolium pratense]|uniref:Uncharacterized protein n=1 Tax=Trifolium pratense TaxID=57577 RepID=A0A2K3L504_TRIPR|nr:hypothetical protein L195_g029517 [Trifolium pratense]
MILLVRPKTFQEWGNQGCTSKRQFDQRHTAQKRGTNISELANDFKTQQTGARQDTQGQFLLIPLRQSSKSSIHLQLLSPIGVGDYVNITTSS